MKTEEKLQYVSRKNIRRKKNRMAEATLKELIKEFAGTEEK